MARFALVLSCLFLLAGCGAHAPKSPAPAKFHVQHYEGEQLITFTGGNGAWLPDDDVALENAAHNAVFGLVKLKAEQLGIRLLSGRVWAGKIVRRDLSGTTYVLVKYEAEVEIPAGQPAIAFNLSR